MAQPSILAGSITTWEGVTLRYTRVGPASAPNILLIPGWAQTAAQWRKQIDFFSLNYSVIAYDHRGHGKSDKPSHGYRISQLASDLNDLILQLNLKDVALIGHSMGCSVIWSYWDSFAESRTRINSLVLVDQSPCMTADPAWSDGYATSISAIFQSATAYGMASGLRGPEAVETMTGVLRSMFTPSISEQDIQWTLEQNLNMSSENAATLLIEHASNDWRDVFPRINVPTLVVGAEGSLFTLEGMEYIASKIPGAKVKAFTKEEKGSHFMFWENPKLFNDVVGEFLEEVYK
jgi:non-heme chloroperoxidase